MKAITASEAARRLGVPRSTIRDWLDTGEVELDKARLVTTRGMATLKRFAEEREQAQKAEEASKDLGRQLLEAQTRERKAIARLRELELEHESGRFVELAAVQRDGEDTAERVLAVLRALPQRVAMRLECSCRRAAVVEHEIAIEVERAIAELQQSLYLQPKEAA